MDGGVVSGAMEALASQLHAAFEDDPLIDEFDYYFATNDNQSGNKLGSADHSLSLNGSVQLVDHKLGLSHVCIKPLYKYAQSVFDSIQNNYTNLLNDDYSSHISREDLKTLSKMSQIMLLIKGESHMLFNIRKRLIGNGIINVSNELVFLKVLFSKHAKSPSGWQHRRWCLLFADKASKAGSPTVDEVVVSWLCDIKDTYQPNTGVSLQIDSEIDLCQLSAEKHPKNYYAWMHRLWLTQYMSVEQIQRECSLMNLWLQQHVSDHSAAAHAYHVIRLSNILSNNNNKQSDAESEITLSKWPNSSASTRSKYRLGLLQSSLQDCASNIGRRPGSEALFAHRRALSDALLSALAGCAPCGGGLLLLAVSQDTDLLRPLDAILNGEYATPQEARLDDVMAAYHIKCKKYNETLNNLYDSSIEYCGSKEMHLLLQSFLESEALFFYMCTSVEFHWNGGKQRLLANRYFAFLLYRISIYLCSVDKGYMYSTDGLCHTLEVEVGVKVAAGIALSGNENSFIFKVNRTLNTLSKRLARDDSACAKLWQAIDAQTASLRSPPLEMHLTSLPAYTTERYYLLSEIEQRVGAINFIAQGEEGVIVAEGVSELSALKYIDEINRIPEYTVRLFYILWNLKIDKNGRFFKSQIMSMLRGVCPQGRDGSLPTAQLSVELLVPVSLDFSDPGMAEDIVVRDMMQWLSDTFGHIFGYIVFGIADDPAGAPALESMLTTLLAVERTLLSSAVPCSVSYIIIAPMKHNLLGHDVMRDPDAKSDVKQSVLASLSKLQMEKWCSSVSSKKTSMLKNAAKSIESVIKTSGSGSKLFFLFEFAVFVVLILYLLYWLVFVRNK